MRQRIILHFVPGGRTLSGAVARDIAIDVPDVDTCVAAVAIVGDGVEEEFEGEGAGGLAGQTGVGGY